MADQLEDGTEDYWTLLRPAARLFEKEAKWPNLDDLLYDAAANGESVDLNLRSRIPNAYGFVDHDDTVVVTGLGLILSHEAPRCVDGLVKLVRLCVGLALQFRKDAKLSPESITEALGADDFLLDRASALVRSVVGLTGGGGSRQDGAWWWDITVSALEYRDIQSVEDLEAFLTNRLREQRQLAAQATAMPAIAPWEPSLGLLPIVEADHQSVDTGVEECDPRNVFVVYGRDKEATQAVWTFLEAIGLHPLSWDELVRSTGTATPYTGAVVAKAFDQVRAVVVLLTPDDEARLHDTLREDDDGAHERELTGQPRPNVFFEAGMAFGRHPDRTVVVEVGALRPATDLSGLNVVRLTGTEGPLQALADRLEGAGCPVNRGHPAWLDTERFRRLAALTRRPSPKSEGGVDLLPVGTRLPGTTRKPEAALAVRLLPHKTSEYLIEIANNGDMDLENISWQLPDDVQNWSIMAAVLPQYPYAYLAKGQHFRVPALVLMGGPVMTDLVVTATAPDGSEYRTTARLSIYG